MQAAAGASGMPGLGVSRIVTGCAGKDGSYGTSVERYKALDPASDIILAWQQNGRLLTPDHGYPLRIIIPGTALGLPQASIAFPHMHFGRMPDQTTVGFPA